jgi:hypothetical protein
MLFLSLSQAAFESLQTNFVTMPLEFLDLPVEMTFDMHDWADDIWFA